MATYQDIKGVRVKYVSADPSTLRAGEVWYNATSNTLKGVVSFAAWSSTAPLITAVFQNAGTGIQTAALSCNGGTGPPASYRSTTEEYDGSAWTAGGVTAYSGAYGGASGTQTSALAGGGDGNAPGACGEYDGTTWTVGGALGFNAYQTKFAGSQTASVAAGGYYQTNAFEYNGSSWTDSGQAMPTVVYGAGAVGTQTAAAFLCGIVVSPPSPSSLTQDWNGSSWSLGPANTLSGGGGQGGGQAPSSDCLLMCAGSPHNRVSIFNGTAWATSPATMAQTRSDFAGAAGNSTAAVAAGGAPPPVGGVAAEEFNVSTSAITAGAWAAGGNLNTPRDEAASAQQGTQDAALYFGGYDGSGNNESEEYNGTAWTEGLNLLTARWSLGGLGIQTAALAFGGSSPDCESYDGTTWTEANNLNTTRSQLAGIGLQGAGLAAGGQTTPSGLGNVEEFNGTSWSEETNLTTARYGFAGAGTQTAGVVFGGVESPPTKTTATEEYDGTNWTAGGSLLLARYNHAGGGAQTAAVAIGGSLFPPAAITGTTQIYNGTAWATNPALGTARAQVSGCAGTSNTAGLAMGGTTPGYTNATEEFTAETSAATASTLTTS